LKPLRTKLFGFPFEVHPSALFILGFIILVQGGGRMGFAVSIMLAVVFFVSIMVHELGHAVAAKAFGLGPIRLVIHGFGGLTSFGVPPTHKQGVLVSLAGPLAGLLLACFAWLIAAVMLSVGSELVTAEYGAVFLLAYTISMLIQVNIFWSLFNLLPIFPLDGGQVMWHGLAMVMPSAVARRRTKQVSIAISAIVGVAALIADQIFIALICLFAFSQNKSIKG
jgi:Zn-dependent protease